MERWELCGIMESRKHFSTSEYHRYVSNSHMSHRKELWNANYLILDLPTITRIYICGGISSLVGYIP